MGPRLTTPNTTHRTIHSRHTTTKYLYQRHINLRSNTTILHHPMVCNRQRKRVDSPTTFILQVTRPYQNPILHTISFRRQGQHNAPIHFMRPIRRRSQGQHRNNRRTKALHHRLMARLSTIQRTYTRSIIPTRSILFLRVTRRLNRRPRIISNRINLGKMSRIPTTLTTSIFHTLQMTSNRAITINHNIRNRAIKVIITTMTIRSSSRQNILQRTNKRIRFMNTLRTTQARSMVQNLQHRKLHPTSTYHRRRGNHGGGALYHNKFRRISRFRRCSVCEPLQTVHRTELLCDPVDKTHRLQNETLEAQALHDIQQ